MSVILSLLLIQSVETSQLSLEEFLARVESQNREFQIAQDRSKALRLQESQPELVFSPQLFSGVQKSQTTETGLSGFQEPGDRSRSQLYQLGIRKDWQWGMHTSFEKSFQKLEWEGFPLLEEPRWSSEWDLRIEQSLWRDFAGRETLRGIRRDQAQLRASSLRRKFEARQLLVDAEMAYWNYALAQRRHESLEGSLKRTKEILGWNQRRLEMNLVDQNDVLQSEAAVLQLNQSLQQAKRQEQEAFRNLNSYLSAPLDSLEEAPKLEPVDLKASEVELSDSWEPNSREDVRAMEELKKAAILDYQSTSASVDPDLTGYIAYGGQGVDPTLGGTIGDMFDREFPRYEIGVQLTMPLGFGNIQSLRAGKELEVQAQKLEYAQAKYQLDKVFYGLRDKVNELLAKIETAKDLKDLQQRKLANENERLRQGRSTSFQVLSFEEDLASAELELLQMQTELRHLMAQLKLFE